MKLTNVLLLAVMVLSAVQAIKLKQTDKYQDFWMQPQSTVKLSVIGAWQNGADCTTYIQGLFAAGHNPIWYNDGCNPTPNPPVPSGGGYLTILTRDVKGNLLAISENSVRGGAIWLPQIHQ